MKRYNNKISLTRNTRGVWSLDTVKGCKYGMARNIKGCYSNCYAYKIARLYGYDFADSCIRNFESSIHLKKTIDVLKTIRSGFVRIGVMGDPSECWGHTIDICNKIKPSGIKVVIVTKHWESLPKYLYDEVKELNLVINTSVSALDDDVLLKNRLSEYHKLKSICTSVLRVVTCDFNTRNVYGVICNNIQENLLRNENVINTVFRPNNDTHLVDNLIINVDKYPFLSSKVIASIKDNNTYFGYCSTCNEKCGLCFMSKETNRSR